MEFEEALEFKNNKYTFSAGKAVVFSTDKSGIKLLNSRNETIGGNESQKSVTISGSDPVEISGVELYYSESDYVAPSWHIVHLERPIHPTENLVFLCYKLVGNVRINHTVFRRC